MDKNESYYSLTKPVTMTFPNLFEARAIGPKGKESGKPKYSANFLLLPDSDDLKGLKALAGKVAKEKWPGRDFGADMKAGKFQLFITPGEKVADKAKAKGKDGEFNRGFVVISARSGFTPKLVIMENGRMVDLDEQTRLVHKDKFFAGTDALASFNLVPYDGVGTNPDGVTAYLGSVLSFNKGKRLGSSGAAASEVFKGYVGSHSNEDPYGADADAGF